MFQWKRGLYKETAPQARLGLVRPAQLWLDSLSILTDSHTHLPPFPLDQF